MDLKVSGVNVFYLGILDGKYVYMYVCKFAKKV